MVPTKFVHVMVPVSTSLFPKQSRVFVIYCAPRRSGRHGGIGSGRTLQDSPEPVPRLRLGGRIEMARGAGFCRTKPSGHGRTVPGSAG